MEGTRRGETCLYVPLSESEEKLRASAESHGWSLEGIKIAELMPSEGSLKPDVRYTIRITAKDSGIGIPGEMLERIFDMFMQVKQTLERPHGGLGIGLTARQAACRDAWWYCRSEK